MSRFEGKGIRLRVSGFSNKDLMPVTQNLYPREAQPFRQET
jgi:hypothetical protein